MVMGSGGADLCGDIAKRTVIPIHRLRRVTATAILAHPRHKSGRLVSALALAFLEKEISALQMTTTSTPTRHFVLFITDEGFNFSSNFFAQFMKTFVRPVSFGREPRKNNLNFLCGSIIC